MAATASFNVGGQLFTTAKETILKEPSSQLALVVRGVAPSKQDVNGAHFIDRWVTQPSSVGAVGRAACSRHVSATCRACLALPCRDPKHFPLILNWLRDGWCALPSTAEARTELALEARHYHVSVQLQLSVHVPVLGGVAADPSQTSLLLQCV